MYQWVVSDEEIYFKSQTLVGRIKLEIEFPFQNLTLIQPHPLKIAEYTVIIWSWIIVQILVRCKEQGSVGRPKIACPRPRIFEDEDRSKTTRPGLRTPDTEQI